MLPIGTGVNHPLLDAVIKLEGRVVEWVRIESLVGVEDVADTDVAVHRFADQRERFGEHLNAFQRPAGQARAQFGRPSA